MLKKFVFILGSLIFLGLAFQAIWLNSLSRMMPAFESLSWPTTEGQIKATQVEHKVQNNKTILYYPQVTFTYNVNNQDFQGSSIIFAQNPPFPTQELAQAKIQGVKPGHKAKVYYNPKNPTQSCLIPGFYENMTIHLIEMGLGIIYMIAGVILVFLGMGKPKTNLAGSFTGL